MISTCKRCGETVTVSRMRDHSEGVTFIGQVLAALTAHRDVLPVADAQGMSDEGVGAFLQAGGAVVVWDDRRGIEAKVLTMSATGTFLMVCPQVTTTRHRDRLIFSAPIFVGADLSDLQAVSDKSDTDLSCFCKVSIRGTVADLSEVAPSRWGRVASQFAKFVSGFWDSADDPDTYFEGSRVRQNVGLDPTVTGAYDYADEGYGHQMAARGKRVDGGPVRGWAV